jgi:DNA repair protein RecN (Recombination protein N)
VYHAARPLLIDVFFELLAMITSLTLQNFALADHVDLDLATGFTVLTGETGAGKSLLLDALSACLGERADAQSVRFGAEKADLTASFDVAKLPVVQTWLGSRELQDEQDEVHLRRVILANGRSKGWINGRPASMADLRDLGSLLVQLHSQHSQQHLLRPRYALHFLDTAAQLQTHALDVRRLYQAWQAHAKQLHLALEAQTQRQARQHTLEQSIEDLLPLAQTDYALLEQEHDRLSHFESMMQDTASLIDGLDDADDNLLQHLAALLKRAEAQASRAPALANVADQLAVAQGVIQDALSTLRQFAQQQELDPNRLAVLDEQLSEYHRLARKYRVTPDALMAQLDTWQTELLALTQLADPQALAEQTQQAQQAFMHAAETLDHARQAAAAPLAQRLSEQLQPLALPEAQCRFAFSPLPAPNADGLMDVQLLFSANRGMPLQPLAKVASGGELSRITLVMQVMQAKHAEAPVLVFDEVDVGISGGTAEIVGRLLQQLGQHVQVLCITHQPQVAAQGDQHLLVEKQQHEQAASHIRQLTDDERVYELARMSGGVAITHTTLDHARSLLGRG